MHQRVCVVEDDELLAHAWRRALPPSCEAVIARTLREAKRLIGSRTSDERFDAVIVDLALPDGDGATLLPLLGALDPRPGIAVVSGNLNAGRSVEMMRMGIPIVPKPLSLSTIRELVTTLCQPREAAPASGRSDVIDSYVTQFELSPKQREVLCCAVEGMSMDETASKLQCRPATVKTHWSRIFTKTGLRTRRDVVAGLLRNSIVDLAL